MLSRFSRRAFASTPGTISAIDVFEKSCYYKIDFKISGEASAKEAVLRFTAFNIGCLAVTDASNKVVGVCSERDYINKIAALSKCDTTTKVKDICTYSPNIIIARNDDITDCP